MTIDKSATMSSGKDDWETPLKVLDCVHDMTAVIGLDPCAGPATDLAVVNVPYATNGLAMSWGGKGLVFVNPPYSQQKLWIPKIIEEAKKEVEIITLLPARTDTMAGQLAMRWARGVCFIAGRLKFLDKGEPAPHSSPFPSMVCYYGTRWAAFSDAFDPIGHCIDRNAGWFGFKEDDGASPN